MSSLRGGSATPRSSQIVAALRPWFRRYRRHFSFRAHPTPYKVLLAELLLRKTRAADVDRLFPLLLDLCPSPGALAAADEPRLRRLIAPLGLSGRARTLVAVGSMLVRDFGGEVPSGREDLLRLPGIGPYAAGAVLAIGFRQRAAMVDGPIGRVLRRVGGMPDNGRAPYYDKLVWAFAERLLPASGVREYQLALLDVAALHCRPTKPLCSTCPLENICSYASRR
jgi:A/G-specific adenine glycosylase